MSATEGWFRGTPHPKLLEHCEECRNAYREGVNDAEWWLDFAPLGILLLSYLMPPILNKANAMKNKAMGIFGCKKEVNKSVNL